MLTETDLAEAEGIQQKRQSLLGQIAIREQYMSVRQVMDVLRSQAGTALPFGAVAVQLGYLDEPDVGELLALQASTRPKLADILIEHGKLSVETYLASLDEFHASAPNADDGRTDMDSTGTGD
jgi:hypothetical protein